MKKKSLSTQLNLSFAIVLVVPMVIAAVFTIVYYSQKIQEVATYMAWYNMKIARIVYRNYVDEMRNLAAAYAQKTKVTNLLPYDLGKKIGLNLADSAQLDRIDLITILDHRNQVLARSHVPDKLHDKLPPKGFIDEALKGKSLSGLEVLQADELLYEGIIEDRHLIAGSDRMLSITGAAPVYNPRRTEIVGVIILRRLINSNSEIIAKLTPHVTAYTAVFEHVRMVQKGASADYPYAFAPPAESLLRKVLDGNAPLTIKKFNSGGSVSILFPLRDFEQQPVGVLMTQMDVNVYLKTRNTAIFSLLTILLIGLMLAYLIKMIVFRRILRPLYALKKGTEEIGKGDYTYRLSVTTTDEIGALTGSFNQMGEALLNYDKELKSYQGELENRVNERTVELRHANDRLKTANRILEDTLETLNPGVSGLIKDNRQMIGLIQATELVMDVCNYTKLYMILGENMVGEFMRIFYRESHKLLAQYHGLLDKTVGDQIVAIFGVPKDDLPQSPYHPFEAVECAIKLMQESQKIDQILQTAIQDNFTSITERYRSLSSEDRKNISLKDLRFRCRIGINTSNTASDREIDRMRMVMMGAETCVDYTTQGGAVIYAFRLESSGEPGAILIGENTKRYVEHVYSLREKPAIKLKGLGVQKGYRVLKRQSFMKNIYPRTQFFQEFRQHVPSELEEMLATLKIARIQIPEIRKIIKNQDIDIAYLEHLAGLFQFCRARALFAYAIGKRINLDRQSLLTVIFTAIWYNAVKLKKTVHWPVTFYSTAEQAPDYIDVKKADRYLAEIAAFEEGKSQAENMEAALIALCNEYDEMVFDRTLLKNKPHEVVSSKEIIALMKINQKFDPLLIQALADLMVVPPNQEVLPPMNEMEMLNPDGDMLLDYIKKHLPEDQKLQLIASLTPKNH